VLKISSTYRKELMVEASSDPEGTANHMLPAPRTNRYSLGARMLIIGGLAVLAWLPFIAIFYLARLMLRCILF